MTNQHITYNHVLHDLKEHVAQSVLFGALLIVSIPPFVAFLILGLGELLDHRYWLSALIVSVVFAATGSILGYRAYRKITNHDLKELLEHAKETATPMAAVAGLAFALYWFYRTVRGLYKLRSSHNVKAGEGALAVHSTYSAD